MGKVITTTLQVSHMWIIKDYISLVEFLQDGEDIKIVCDEDDFSINYISYVGKSLLEIKVLGMEIHFCVTDFSDCFYESTKHNSRVVDCKVWNCLVDHVRGMCTDLKSSMWLPPSVLIAAQRNIRWGHSEDDAPPKKSKKIDEELINQLIASYPKKRGRKTKFGKPTRVASYIASMEFLETEDKALASVRSSLKEIITTAPVIDSDRVEVRRKRGRPKKVK